MENNHRHLYVIPTNRLCLQSIESLSKEVLYAEQKADVNLSMVMIDGSSEETARENHRAFTAASQAFQSSESHYFRTEEIDGWIRNVLKTMNSPRQDKLLPLFIHESLSYGIAANRTFLIAALLHADYLHRRDSDVALQRKNNGELLYPIEIELDYLGKPLNAFNGSLPNANQFKDEDLLYMVGGSYKGNWAVDFEDLARANMESVYQLIHLVKPWATYEQTKELVDRRFVAGSTEEYMEDELFFPVDNFIEVGNYSLYRIFHDIPVAPALFTSGTDYIYHALLGNAKLPMLYHNRRVLHQHTTDRKEEKWIFSYHLRLAMYRCLTRYYSIFYKELASRKEVYLHNGAFDADKVGEYLMELSARKLQDEQEHVLQSMMKIYRDSGINKYIRLADYIDEHRQMIMDKSSGDVYNHGLLTKEWGEIIRFIKEHGRRILAH